jgi:modulator of FtsH protease
MSTGYDIAAWHELFGAEVGAAAALAGLLFVAISINLTRILAIAHLASRAGTGLAILVAVLVLSTLALVPGITDDWLGTGILVVAIAVWIAPTSRLIRQRRGDRPLWRFIGDHALTQASLVPSIVGGVTLIAGSGGGLYWLVPAVAFSFVTAALNAWVLLVEIMR